MSDFTVIYTVKHCKFPGGYQKHRVDFLLPNGNLTKYPVLCTFDPLIIRENLFLYFKALKTYAVQSSYLGKRNK